MIDADALGDRFCGASVIAREHINIESQRFELLNCRAAGRFHRVRGSHQGMQLTIERDIHERFSRAGESQGVCDRIRDIHVVFNEQLCATCEHAATVHNGFYAASGYCAELLHCMQCETARLSRLHDGPRNRVFRAALGRGGEQERFILRVFGEAVNVGEFRFTLRDGARFIEYDGVDAVRGLERLAALDQNAEFRAFARANHDGGWRGETQRAGAGDHEYGDEDIEHEVKIFSHQRPDDRGENRDAQHRRNKIARDDVREFRDGCLSALRLFDQVNDLGERGVLAHAGHTKA